ncbi:MAG: UDP-N-acetylglucosamine--N-acetylmuramyl-(pentapeptide) pyrophosphoryl-undecaprenol N-acetylglucosamine transferase [bacterium]
MKILMTGGGSGGHFYPLIAVAESIREISREEKILEPQVYFMSNNPYNEKELFDLDIKFVDVPAGKKRLYKSVLNFFDKFKMAWGCLVGLVKMFFIFPDVVFGKGAYTSFPAYLAARILGIPVFIHESDSVPGRVNAWAGKFAARIAVSYKEAGEFFPKDKVAYTGQPVRREIRDVLSTGAFEYLNLEKDVPVILILGGSSGAQIINDAILNSLPVLLNKYQIIHQVGRSNITSVKGIANVALEGHPHKDRYRPFDYLTTIALRMSAGSASLVISRGGSSIFEIACWGLPSIIVPITNSNGDHQRKNAYNYARDGAAVVIEESNLSSNIICNEIDRIISNATVNERMRHATQKTAQKNASNVIARELLKIGLSHENE